MSNDLFVIIGMLLGLVLTVGVYALWPRCNHQWNTIENGELTREAPGRDDKPIIGRYWYDECTTCGKVRTRKAMLTD